MVLNQQIKGSILDNGGDDAGKYNAFEEFAVRELTKRVMAGDYPSDLTAYGHVP